MPSLDRNSAALHFQKCRNSCKCALEPYRRSIYVRRQWADAGAPTVALLRSGPASMPQGWTALRLASMPRGWTRAGGECTVQGRCWRRLRSGPASMPQGWTALRLASMPRGWTRAGGECTPGEVLAVAAGRGRHRRGGCCPVTVSRVDRRHGCRVQGAAGASATLPGACLCTSAVDGHRNRGAFAQHFTRWVLSISGLHPNLNTL